MKLLLHFSSKIIKEPLIAETILETGAKININRANIGAVSGETVLDVPDDMYETIMASFRSREVDVVPLSRPIFLDESKCLSCGTCISICPFKLFEFEDDWRVLLDEERCIQCGACITACPFGALGLMVSY